jgi:hypothetical protein
MAHNLIHLHKILYLRTVFAILLAFILAADAFCQKDSIVTGSDSLPASFYVLQSVERDGITMPEVEIKEVTVVARPTKKQKRDYRQYQKLVDHIKKVYPYALMVRRTLYEVNEEMARLKTERQRKEYMKDMEKKVFAEYEDDMRNMTFTQAKILIKLIDRETQNTSYELIRDYRGKFSAAFWQGVARIFGTNLKDHYDPYGADALIEQIIGEIEEGNL